MFQSFLVGREKGGMEDRVNLPPRRDAEMEGCAGDNFFNFKGTGSFHLELFGTVHMKVGGFEPDLVSHFPRGEFGGYSLFHLLLGYFVGSLGIFSSGRQV